MKIGIIGHADCAHFLPDHPKCGAPHGHTYRVELIVEGDLRDGMVMDFADLKQILQDVLQQYDHKSWNDFLDYPSVENICALLHRDLRKQVSIPCTLRVWEGEGKWAEL
jgi:6-pyruvoyltetrahydropterin/6-carboxytetrahydropterin synthase